MKILVIEKQTHSKSAVNYKCANSDNQSHTENFCLNQINTPIRRVKKAWQCLKHSRKTLIIFLK